VFENMIFLQAGAKDATVVALDKADGKLLWKSRCGEASHSTPVVYRNGAFDNKPCLAVFLGDGFVGLDAKTGAQFYKFPYTCKWGLTICNPLVVGDKVFISAGYGGGAVLVDVSGAEPKTAWKDINFSNQRTTSVLWKGHLYGIDGDNDRKPFLKCYEFATGKEMWSHAGLGNGSLMLADGKLIIQGEKGDLVVADATPDGYKELAHAKPLDGKCWTMPVLCAGRIYCRNHAGDLVCLDVGGK
jgi:outer membrane protein assembly factor BamB